MKKALALAHGYRIKAHDCLDVAERCHDEPRRTRLLNMALLWLLLSEQAQRNAKTDLIYEARPPQPRESSGDGRQTTEDG